MASIFTKNHWRENVYAEEYLRQGFWVSARAGVFEEIIFRWIFFYALIPWITLVNWLFLGFAGLDVLKWLFEHVLGPVANFATLGKLAPYLAGGASWAVGSALLSANGMFRNGHKYLGLFGFINSWFIGMFLFYIMFRYGLPVAIAVHFLYDLLIFVIRYLDAVIERARGHSHREIYALR